MTTPSQPNVAQDLVNDLSEYQEKLAAAYPRTAHHGRLEQIGQHLVTLQSLISQLPDEEEREADYASRLLDMHGKGIITPEMQQGQDKQNAHPQSAYERLNEALAAQQNGA